MDGLFLSVILTDEKRNESVRVLISDDGMAAVTGRGDLLNWFCEQIPHFRGLYGDSLPDGRSVYVHMSNAKDNRYTPVTLGHGIGLPAPSLLRQTRDG